MHVNACATPFLDAGRPCTRITDAARTAQPSPTGGNVNNLKKNWLKCLLNKRLQLCFLNKSGHHTRWSACLKQRMGCGQVCGVGTPYRLAVGQHQAWHGKGCGPAVAVAELVQRQAFQC